ncbi:MAG: hypothetical protein Q8P90_04490 [bacterium]|nr:hypothetical protein [bacterium]
MPDIEQSTPEQNPFLDLDQHSAWMLRQVIQYSEAERTETEQELSNAGVGARRLAETLKRIGELPKEFDAESYIGLVDQISKLEAEITTPSPSIAAEEVSLAKNGNVEGSQIIGELKQKLAPMDEEISSVLGISRERAHQAMDDEQSRRHLENLHYDKQDVARNNLKQRMSHFAGQSKAWKIETAFNVAGRFPYNERIKDTVRSLEAGMPNAEELAPQPEKGTFQYLEDNNPTNSEIPVKLYERQLVKTSRDAVSPDFSSCAGIMMYKLDNNGVPEQESIVAHLPPKVYGDMSERPSDFKDYDDKFFSDQLGTTDLTGYQVKIIAGLKISPAQLADTLTKMGATVETVEQLPRDMYTAYFDATSKTIVVRGVSERITDSSRGDRVSYRTDEHKIPITQEDWEAIAIVE